MEKCAHRSADDFRVVRIDGRGNDGKIVVIEGNGGANNGAEIAGI